MLDWRKFFKRRQNWLALFLVGSFFFVALAAPWLAPPDDPANPPPFKGVGRTFDRLPQAPNEESPLGTVGQLANLARFGFTPGQDRFEQWDVWYTLVWGTRSALKFGLIVTLTSATLGILVGIIAGYAGGVINQSLMLVTDAFLTFPVIAAVWLFQRVLYTRLYNPFVLPEELVYWEQFLLRLDIDPIMLAMIVFSWMPYARLVNGMVIQQKHADYITAAHAMGAHSWRIIWRHLLPNAISPAVVFGARDVGSSVILATAFIFIGFAGSVTWGVMLVAARDYVIGLSGNPFAYWWTFIPISLGLILFGVGWNLLGDGLNDLLNPRTR
ncbi:MAG: ABC transporter permease [Ardenticatenaceae bacterium]|nr:ABC transporter permease [Anaerolineales bacterium]MCB8982913.1 ABC transporter permease [Ardenticatenaceae bacterium]MCB8986371.1 ABC transporter permease [Ardenticatenaceae bacterium]